MNHRTARGVSWGATVLCAICLAWLCYQLQRQVPVMAQLLAGLGTELPASTRFVIWVSSFGYIWPVGLLLILLLVGKELLVRDTAIRLAITFGVFLSAAWFFGFAVTAMREPLVSILEKVG